MNASARLAVLSTLSCALLFFHSGQASAQAMYKCLKGTSVTYSNTPCDQLGLKSAGTVRDRMTTLPMGGSQQSAQAKAPAGGGKAQPVGDKANQIDMPPTSTVKPVNPLIEKLAR